MLARSLGMAGFGRFLAGLGWSGRFGLVVERGHARPAREGTP